MSFPIFNIENGEITNLKGEKSKLYELKVKDLEQMNDLEESHYLENLKKSLLNLKESLSYKIYKLGNKLYINSSIKPDLDFDLIEVSSPLKTVLGELNYSDIVFYENYFCHNSKYFRLITLKKHLNEVSLAEQYDLDADIIISFKRDSLVKNKAKLNQKRRLHLSSLSKNIKDIESESAYSSSEGILEDILSGEEALFHVQVAYLLKADNKKKLDLKTENLVREIKLNGGEAFQSQFQNTEFKRILPGVFPSFNSLNETTASYLSHLLPLNTDRIHSSGIRLLSKREDELCFDLFNSESHNYNLLISGPSGQGKSVLANKLIKESIESNTKVFILDLGNSFKKTVKYYNGEILSKSFNPLRFKDPNYVHQFLLSVSCLQE